MEQREAQLSSTVSFCVSWEDGSISPESAAGRDETGICVGTTIGERYVVQRQLGAGAMGRVFVGLDTRLDRQVAIKVMFQKLSDAALHRAMQREARLGASLSHPGIASVYDFGLHEGGAYTVFEYVEGETLRALLNRQSKLSAAECSQLLSQLSDALDFAHSMGVVHRDLKPENICLTRSGTAKILDFGIALNIHLDRGSGTYSGTPAYSSPEQASCSPTDGRSDQYSLGVIAFEILAGRRPFGARDPLELLKSHTEDALPGLLLEDDTIPNGLAEIVHQSLSKDPRQRFPTCSAFAEAAAEHVVSTGVQAGAPHLTSMRLNNQNDVYIAHTSDDTPSAAALANYLQERGLKCWHYSRDAVPGVPLRFQCEREIERSRIAVLLISRNAVRRVDFEGEIRAASQFGCVLVPVLVDLHVEEFEALAPPWRQAFGSQRILSSEVDSISGHLAEVAGVLAAHGLPVVDPGQTEATASPVVPDRAVWSTDASRIEIEHADDVLFRTTSVDAFLSQPDKHFVCGAKGYGKTLLLTCKRHQMTAKAGGRNPVTMIPEGRPYLDFMSDIGTLPRNQLAQLADVQQCKRRWLAAFRISAISHAPQQELREDEGLKKRLPRNIHQWLVGGRANPTVVFKELTAMGIRSLHMLLDEVDGLLDHHVRLIHTGMMFFVDKIDHAIADLPRDAWISVQAGMLEAASELMTTNSHLKVYASIRQEAFANYESVVSSNLMSEVVRLDYSEPELRRMVDHLAGVYEKSSFAEFCGVNVVRHYRRPAPESCFQFVRRHTQGRPRDLVAIAAEVSLEKSFLSEQRLRGVVKQTGALLTRNCFAEVSVFLSCLGDPDNRQLFFSLLSESVLTREQAIEVSECFNGLPAGSLDFYGDESPDLYHPFRDLYFAGLLGVVVDANDESGQIQRFRAPNESFEKTTAALYASSHFLLHPALIETVRDASQADFLHFELISVGADLAWEHYYPALMQAERLLRLLPDRRPGEAGLQLLKRIHAALITSGGWSARVDLSASPEFRVLRERMQDDSCAEIILWIESLLDELSHEE